MPVTIPVAIAGLIFILVLGIGLYLGRYMRSEAHRLSQALNAERADKNALQVRFIENQEDFGLCLQDFSRTAQGMMQRNPNDRWAQRLSDQTEMMSQLYQAQRSMGFDTGKLVDLSSLLPKAADEVHGRVDVQLTLRTREPIWVFLAPKECIYALSWMMLHASTKNPGGQVIVELARSENCISVSFRVYSNIGPASLEARASARVLQRMSVNVQYEKSAIRLDFALPKTDAHGVLSGPFKNMKPAVMQ